MSAMTPRCVAAALVAAVVVFEAAAQPPAGRDPILRIEAGAPTTAVTSLTFGPESRRLFVTGLDKVVRVWALDEKGTWKVDPFAFRVPIGPGRDGALNAVAVSSDGEWLAAAGHGVAEAGFRQVGFIIPAAGLSKQQYEQIGTIFVWNTRTRAVKVLRGHTGDVRALAFAPAEKGKPVLLASVAEDRNFQGDAVTNEHGVALWRVDADPPVRTVPRRAALPDLSPDGNRPELAVWRVGDGPHDAWVALAWGDGDGRLVGGDRRRGFFRIWDASTDAMHRLAGEFSNDTVAVGGGPGRALVGCRVATGAAPTDWA